jgi:hypothetical protein
MGDNTSEIEETKHRKR